MLRPKGLGPRQPGPALTFVLPWRPTSCLEWSESQAGDPIACGKCGLQICWPSPRDGEQLGPGPGTVPSICPSIRPSSLKTAVCPVHPLRWLSVHWSTRNIHLPISPSICATFCQSIPPSLPLFNLPSSASSSIHSTTPFPNSSTRLSTHLSIQQHFLTVNQGLKDEEDTAPAFEEPVGKMDSQEPSSARPWREAEPGSGCRT